MRCRYSKKIYKNEENGFCVYVYHTDDMSVPPSARNKYYHGDGFEFTAVGNNLPSADTVEVDLKGKWNKGKCGLQLQVETYEELLPSSEEGIKGYLSSGMIKGVGPKTAEQIVNCFGTRTFEVLDKYPESLLQIKGITEKKLQAILSSYQESHAMRDLAAYLAPFQVTPRKIRKIYNFKKYDKFQVNQSKMDTYLCKGSVFCLRKER